MRQLQAWPRAPAALPRKHSGQSPFPCSLRSPPCPEAGAGASWLRMLIRNLKGAAALLASSRVCPVPPRPAAPAVHKSRAARRAGGGGPLAAPSPFAFWWLLNHEVLVSAAQDHPWSGSWGRDAGKDPGGAAGGEGPELMFPVWKHPSFPGTWRLTPAWDGKAG